MSEETIEQHVMIDIETLSIENNAVIVSIGACSFNMYDIDSPEKDTFYRELEWADQITKGRDIQKSTINWWNSLPISIPKGKEFPEYSMIDLLTWCKLVKPVNYWFRGPQFDCVKLESLAKDYGCEVPWKFWEVKDSRTLDLFEHPRLDKPTVLHKADDDAIQQAKDVIHTIQQLMPEYRK